MTRGIEGGTDYLRTANSTTLSFAMIETREAFDIASDIAALDGIDALFVGPSDFSIAWTGGEAVDPSLPDMEAAVSGIAQIARDAGKHAGIFAANPAIAPRYVEMGFRFIALGLDTNLVAAGQKAVLSAAGALKTAG